MHTDFMGEEELNRLCYDYAALHRTYGIENRNGDDGRTWPASVHCAIVLAGSGMRYLITEEHLHQRSNFARAEKVPFYGNLPTAVAS